jgi:hypothetical protein
MVKEVFKDSNFSIIKDDNVWIKKLSIYLSLAGTSIGFPLANNQEEDEDEDEEGQQSLILHENQGKIIIFG